MVAFAASHRVTAVVNPWQRRRHATCDSGQLGVARAVLLGGSIHLESSMSPTRTLVTAAPTAARPSRAAAEPVTAAPRSHFVDAATARLPERGALAAGFGQRREVWAVMEIAFAEHAALGLSFDDRTLLCFSRDLRRAAREMRVRTGAPVGPLRFGACSESSPRFFS